MPVRPSRAGKLPIAPDSLPRSNLPPSDGLASRAIASVPVPAGVASGFGANANGPYNPQTLQNIKLAPYNTTTTTNMTGAPSAPSNFLGTMKSLGAAPAVGMKKGGKVSSASKRADGIATKGKTRGRFV